MKVFHTTLFCLCLIFSQFSNAETFSYTAGGAYCAITHPVEFAFKLGNKRTTCEQQHVIQRQTDGGDIENIVWWPTSHHVRTDVTGSKPWESARPWLVLGFTGDNNVNLEKAYMLGTHGLSWSLFQHSYNGKGDSSLIAFEFDGISNLLYGFSWLINIPQKFIHQTAFLLDKGHLHLLVDMLILVFVLAFEAVIAIFITVVGAVAGSIMNPVDTLFAIPGGLWLAFETVIAAIFQTVSAIWSLLTSGLLGLILSPFVIFMSITPYMLVSKFTSDAKQPT